MRTYRVQVEVDSSDREALCVASILGWDPVVGDWVWLPLSSWTVNAEPKTLAHEVQASLLVHGWLAQEALPQLSGHAVAVEVRPVSYKAVATDLAAARSRVKGELAALESALANLVADLPRRGDEGHLGVTALARIVDFTKPRLYQFEKGLVESMREQGVDAESPLLTERERDKLL